MSAVVAMYLGVNTVIRTAYGNMDGFNVGMHQGIVVPYV